MILDLQQQQERRKGLYMSSLGSVVLYGQVKRENDKNTLSHFRKRDHESVSMTHLTKGLPTRPLCLRLMFEINWRNWDAVVYYWHVHIKQRIEHGKSV